MEVQGNNKNKILDIALDLFSEQGFESVGIQKLCEKADITKPTLYHYFGNKEGVLQELLKQNYSKFNKLIEKNITYNAKPDYYEEDVYLTLTNLSNAYFSFAKKNKKFYQIVLYATFGPSDTPTNKIAKVLNKKQYEFVETMFKNISNIHKNMEGKEKRLAWTFIGLINTYIALGKFSQDTTENIVKQFMHGIHS